MQEIMAAMVALQRQVVSSDRNNRELREQQESSARDSEQRHARDLSAMEERHNRRDAAQNARLDQWQEEQMENDEVRTTLGCELWVGESQLLADLEEKYVWWNVAEQRVETAVEVSWRIAYWLRLKAVLPPEMFITVEMFDIYDIYIRLCTFNRKESAELIGDVTMELSLCTKGSLPMGTWLDKLFRLVERLEVLSSPPQVNTVQAIIRASLKGDARYKDAVKDCLRHPKWDLFAWRTILMSAARDEGDLVDKRAPTTGNGAPRGRINKVTTVTEEPAQAPQATNESSLMAQLRVLTAQVSRMSQAHSPPDGKPKDERPRRSERLPKDPAVLTQMATEACQRFMLGRCPHGDTCPRQHLSGKAVGEYQKAHPDFAKKMASERDEGAKRMQAIEAGECFTFNEDGKCDFGDKCRFIHNESKRKVNRVRMKRVCAVHNHPRRKKMPIAANAQGPELSKARAHALSPQVRRQALSHSHMLDGAMVVLLAGPLRGILAQVFSFTPERAYAVPVHCKRGPERDGIATETSIPIESLDQYISNMELSGMREGSYYLLPPRVAAYLNKLRRDEKAGTGRQARVSSVRLLHTLNAIFDTGANVAMSSHKEAFDKLRPCRVQVAVYGDNLSVDCTHWGYLTATVGSVSRLMKTYYCEYAHEITIVPGTFWDTLPVDGIQYWFRGINHTLEFYERAHGEDVLLGVAARAMTKGANSSTHSKEYLQDVETEDGRAEHILYPLPDAWFKMSGAGPSATGTPHAAHGQGRGQGQGRGRGRGQGLVRMAAARKQHQDVSRPQELASDDDVPELVPGSDSDSESEDEDEGGSPVQALSRPPDHLDLTAARSTPPAASAEEAFARTEAIAVTQERQALEDFHHQTGHRAATFTQTLYEWHSGKRLSAETRAFPAPCSACITANITDRPHPTRTMAKATMAGEEISADTIVGLTRSISEFTNIGHFQDVFSNYGAVVPSKTKALDAHLMFFMRKMRNLTGRAASRLKIDSGEYKSSRLVSLLREMGTTVMANLADVHSNPSIERRHKTVKEIMRALMHHANAPACLWEFAVVTANEILNRTPTTKALRSAGRPKTGRRRPITPWEIVQNKGVLADLKTLSRFMEPIYVRVTYYVEKGSSRNNHEDRGRGGINLGPIPDIGSVTYHGYNVVDDATNKLVKARSISVPRTWVYAFRDRIREIHSPEGSDAMPLEDSTLNPGGEKTGPGEEPATVKGGRANRPDKYPPGTTVMTTDGEFEVVCRYIDGEYCVQRPGTTAEETVKEAEIWTSAEYPGWVYAEGGAYLGDAPLPVEPEPRLQLPANLMPDRPMPKWEFASERKVEGPAGRTRSHQGQVKCVVLSAKMLATQGEPQDDQGHLAQAVRSHIQHEYAQASRSQQLPSEIEDTLQLRAYKTRLSHSVPPTPETWGLRPTTAELRKLEAIDVSPFVPKHYHQAVASPLAHECERGQVKELQDCLNRGVWGNPVEVQPDWVVIGLMWVYAIKAKCDMYERVRSRITLLGNQEKVDLTTWQAYAPVSQIATSRLMIAIHLGMPGVKFRKIDVKNAYINENMRRRVRTKMPPGYQFYVDEQGELRFRRLRPGEKQDPRFCLPLIKALYGGMECGRIFWEAWTDWHLAHGFTIIHEERCYLEKRCGQDFIKMCYHVDDNQIAQRGEELWSEYLAEMSARFDVTEGPLEENLGLRYTFSKENGDTLCNITQTPQIKKFIAEFGMTACTTTDSPCLGGPPPCAEDCETPYDGDWDMMSFVGHGSYLQMCTRPDITLTMKLLSRATAKFGHKHVMWAKHLLRYLQGTTGLGLHYRSGWPHFLQFFTDASHASCVDTRRSILSMCAFYAGNLIFWKSCYSSIVSHSSTESELMAVDLAARIAEGVKALVASMGGPDQRKVPVFVDNTGTITIGENPVQSGRNLHVHARYFYVRDLVYADALELCHLPTQMQVADIGCTFKGGPAFRTLRPYLMECARVVHDAAGTPRWEFRGKDGR